MIDETTRTQEMGDLPIGCSAKIDRAKQHLQSLKASTEAFVDDGKAYSVVKEADRNAGKYSFRLKVERDPPVIEWSLMIGDCLHNARTSLDHLFWALVNKRHPDGFTGKTSNLNFPILKDASTFKGREINLKNAVGDAVFGVLERLQPFNDARGQNRNPLMFLHDFDIGDKHRLLVPAVSILDSALIKPITVDNKTTKFDGAVRLLQFQDGAEIAQFIARVPEDVLDMDIEFTFDVIFKGQPGPLRVVPNLERTLEVVEAAAAEFVPFF